MGPDRAMLLSDVVVGVGDLFWKHEAIHRTLGLPKRLEALGTEHLAKGIGRVHRTVDNDMGDVDVLGREFGVQVWQSMRRPPIAAACEC